MVFRINRVMCSLLHEELTLTLCHVLAMMKGLGKYMPMLSDPVFQLIPILME